MIYSDYFKPLFDVMLSLILILLVSPLLFLVSIYIYSDNGFPILYKQERVGKFKKIFGIYKFRTMVVNADKLGSTSTQIGDSRITNSGKILRKLSLDELPQLFNVIKGDMSLIGYRPGVLSQYDDSFLLSDVFNSKPGITGLAQISGRSSLSSERKRELELEYARNITFFGDVKILLSTVFKVFSARGAF
jgi:lipopolysaccharide/colanic/teichoic acid biosynthesis glycosyltransferase